MSKKFHIRLNSSIIDTLRDCTDNKNQLLKWINVNLAEGRLEAANSDMIYTYTNKEKLKELADNLPAKNFLIKIPAGKLFTTCILTFNFSDGAANNSMMLLDKNENTAGYMPIDVLYKENEKVYYPNISEAFGETDFSQNKANQVSPFTTIKPETLGKIAKLYKGRTGLQFFQPDADRVFIRPYSWLGAAYGEETIMLRRVLTIVPKNV